MSPRVYRVTLAVLIAYAIVALILTVSLAVAHPGHGAGRHDHGVADGHGYFLYIMRDGGWTLWASYPTIEACEVAMFRMSEVAVCVQKRGTRA